jgi:uncharacterized protein YraI
MRTRLILAAFLAALLAPAAAKAQNAYVVSLGAIRAGPGTDYPRIVVLDRGNPLDVYGCLQGWNWCDVSWQGTRGWMRGDHIGYAYGGQWVPVPSYGPRLGVPIITFDFGYWDRYYRNRDFYRNRGEWERRHPEYYRRPDWNDRRRDRDDWRRDRDRDWHDRRGDIDRDKWQREERQRAQAREQWQRAQARDQRQRAEREDAQRAQAREQWQRDRAAQSRDADRDRWRAERRGGSPAQPQAQHEAERRSHGRIERQPAGYGVPVAGRPAPDLRRGQQPPPPPPPGNGQEQGKHRHQGQNGAAPWQR